MKRLLIFSLICVLSGMTIACERGVRAGREGEPETYQPRPAPLETSPMTGPMAGLQMKGELMRIDQKDQTVTVRAENGMEQTFKINTQTMVRGIPGQQPGAQTQTLMGKEGSEIVITWKDEAGAKTATIIEVTNLGPKSKEKRGTQRRY